MCGEYFQYVKFSLIIEVSWDERQRQTSVGEISEFGYETFTSADSFVCTQLTKYMCTYWYRISLSSHHRRSNDSWNRVWVCRSQTFPLQNPLWFATQTCTAELVDAKLIAIEKSVSVIIVDFIFASRDREHTATTNNFKALQLFPLSLTFSFKFF